MAAASRPQRSAPAHDHYEHVIVGGGIAGVSVALHLAEAGTGRILLMEQSLLGSGATAYSSGGVRQQFSTELEIRLSIEALRFWRAAEARFGIPCPFSETGYLFVTTRQSVLDQLRRASQLQTALGADPSFILGPEELADLVPWMRTDDLAGGCWTPRDGRIVPADGVAAIARGARAAGAEIREHSPVSSLERTTAGFRISGGVEVSADNVVVTAGLATTGLLAPLGHAVDVRPWMIHYAYTEPALTPYRLPTTIDLDLGMTVKRDGHGLNVGILDETLPLDSSPHEMLESFFDAASHRAPDLTDVGIVRTVSAAADLSTDGHPYAGMLEDGLWVLAGFGGHGTMHGPVIAGWLVDEMLGRDISHRLGPFHPHRDPAGGETEWMVASRKT